MLLRHTIELLTTEFWPLAGGPYITTCGTEARVQVTWKKDNKLINNDKRNRCEQLKMQYFPSTTVKGDSNLSGCPSHMVLENDGEDSTVHVVTRRGASATTKIPHYQPVDN